MFRSNFFFNPQFVSKVAVHREKGDFAFHPSVPHESEVKLGEVKKIRPTVN
jgi:hypothetical protein